MSFQFMILLFQIIHEKLYDDIVAKLKKAYTLVKIGDPLDQGTLYGPMHSKQGVQQYLDTIEEIKKAGGTIECGGKVGCV